VNSEPETAMKTTLKNAPSKRAPFAEYSQAMPLSIRRLWLSRVGILCFTFLCTWLGIVSIVCAESAEKSRIVDMSSLSCGEFLQLPLPQALIAVGWIGGFYAGLKNDPNVNVPEFADKADQIIALCRGNESTGVMALVERTLHPLQAPSTE
jgi:HdeA/HdeB family